MYEIFRLLASKLEPDCYSSVESLEKRKPDENIVDFVIRICTDWEIFEPSVSVDKFTRILKFIIAYETNPDLHRELSRELMQHSGNVTEMNLFEIAERVNRLVGSPRNVGQVFTTAVEDQEDEFYAIQQTDSRPKCTQCKKAFVNITRNGKPFEFCDPCFRSKRRSQPFQRNPIYNRPTVSKKVEGKCLDCNKDATRTRYGAILSRCHDCYQKFIRNRPGPLNVHAFDQVVSGQMEQVAIDEIENEVQKSQFLAINVDAIRRVKQRNKFNADRYRMKAKVFNSDKSKCLDALLDTGCNTDALSLDACKKLGIDSDIERKPSLATGVDGHNLSVVGAVKATVHVGNVPYTSTFPVLEKIDGFDVMIGTKFMQSASLMTKVVDLMKDNLGAENVERTN